MAVVELGVVFWRKQEVRGVVKGTGGGCGGKPEVCVGGNGIALAGEGLSEQVQH